MREGFSYNQDDESAGNEARGQNAQRKGETFDRFKVFLGDLFRTKDRPEQAQDTNERSVEKRSRFARAWRRLFRARVAETEPVTGEQPRARSGLFFEMQTTREAGTDQAPATETPAEPTEATERPAMPAAEAPLTQGPVNEAYEPAAPEQPNDGTAEVPMQQAPQPHEQASAHAQEQTVLPTMVYREARPGTEARLRQVTTTAEQAEKKAKKAQKEAVQAVKTVEKSASKAPESVAQAVQAEKVFAPKAPEKAPKAPEQKRAAKEVLKHAMQKVETSKQPSTPEVKISFKKEEIYNVRPEVQAVVEKLEAQETNEKAYELSHEHKDLDKQAAVSMALLQQQADDHAKAAAAVLAQATKQQAAQLAAKQAKNKATAPLQLAQTAAVGGFIALVVVIAIIFAVLLIK